MNSKRILNKKVGKTTARIQMIRCTAAENEKAQNALNRYKPVIPIWWTP